MVFVNLPLEFDEERTRLSVIANVKFNGKPPVPVLFVIDTGSPVTFVDEFDSSKVRIFAKNLNFDHDALMGGSKVSMYKAGTVEMNFLDDKEDLTHTEFKSMMIAKQIGVEKAKYIQVLL